MSDKHIKPRMHRRIPLKVGLTLTGDYEGEGTILEMSEGGLSFSAAKPAPKGARVLLTISDEAAELAIDGTIMHSSDRSGEHVSGVQFDALDADTRKLIQGLLKRHRFTMFRGVPTR